MAHRTNLQRRMYAAWLSVGAVLCVVLAGCGGQQAQARRFALKGTVVSIDRPQQRIVVDAEEIKGFMAAMAMPYPVVEPQLLDVAAPGDQITADVVVTDTSAHLENIVVVKKAEPPQPGGSLREKIAPDGSVRRWYGSNDWKPADVLADLEQPAVSPS
jgi:Copper binding periplasmic protein CusF